MVISSQRGGGGGGGGRGGGSEPNGCRDIKQVCVERWEVGGKGWLSTGPSEHLQTEQESFEALSLSWGQGWRRGLAWGSGYCSLSQGHEVPSPRVPKSALSASPAISSSKWS